MADWHKIRIRTGGNQWVTEDIPAGTVNEAKRTAQARWPEAKKIEWQGTTQDPESRRRSEQFEADSARKTADWNDRQRNSNANQAMDPPAGGGSSGGSGGYSGGSDEPGGCACLLYTSPSPRD